MGRYEWACPECGQTQQVRAPNGTEVTPRLCAACEEKKHQAQIENDHTREEAKGNKARARA